MKFQQCKKAVSTLSHHKKNKNHYIVNDKWAYAVKSAEAVAAFRALLSKQQLQTAPLWPSKVPIQSPVSPFLSIGLESTITIMTLTSKNA